MLQKNSKLRLYFSETETLFFECIALIDSRNIIAIDYAKTTLLIKKKESKSS